MTAPYNYDAEARARFANAPTGARARTAAGRTRVQEALDEAELRLLKASIIAKDITRRGGSERLRRWRLVETIAAREALLRAREAQRELAGNGPARLQAELDAARARRQAAVRSAKERLHAEWEREFIDGVRRDMEDRSETRTVRVRRNAPMLKLDNTARMYDDGFVDVVVTTPRRKPVRRWTGLKLN